MSFVVQWLTGWGGRVRRSEVAPDEGQAHRIADAMSQLHGWATVDRITRTGGDHVAVYVHGTHVTAPTTPEGCT